ncbi:unnamed protein product [Ixodes pacificus]
MRVESHQQGLGRRTQRPLQYSSLDAALMTCSGRKTRVTQSPECSKVESERRTKTTGVSINCRPGIPRLRAHLIRARRLFLPPSLTDDRASCWRVVLLVALFSSFPRALSSEPAPRVVTSRAICVRRGHFFSSLCEFGRMRRLC